MLNSRPLLWKCKSLPLDHQGSTSSFILTISVLFKEIHPPSFNIFLAVVLSGCCSQYKTIFHPETWFGSSLQNFLFCGLTLTINIHMVEGGSEENVNNCWLLAADRAGNMNSLSIRSGVHVGRVQGSVCAYRQSTDSTFVKMLSFAICSLMFTQRSLTQEHLCWREEQATRLYGFPRAPGGQRSCPRFSGAASSCERQRWSCLSLGDWHSLPGSV